jgi:hypothetical protein
MGISTDGRDVPRRSVHSKLGMSMYTTSRVSSLLLGERVHAMEIGEDFLRFDVQRPVLGIEVPAYLRLPGTTPLV